QFQLNLKALDRETEISELKKFADDVSPKNILSQIEDDISDAMAPPEIVEPIESEQIPAEPEETSSSSDEVKKDD
ncbi:MAG: hypothetical protein VX423_03875, partial [Pseudomonadota bacterium]|nr:hypothetical protein [Pseudomonadota bacterium]